MSALVLVVQHRTVDLVAMSALHALRTELRHTGLRGLRREDALVLEGSGLGPGDDPEPWRERCLEQANWHNPNKHRYALFAAAAGVHAAVRGKAAFPRPWPGRMLATDRPDLAGRSGATWREWSGGDGVAAGTSVTLATWELEEPVKSLPGRGWPGPVKVARLQLWTLHCADDASTARELAQACAVTRSRREGLLLNPHMEGWSFVEPDSAQEAAR